MKPEQVTVDFTKLNKASPLTEYWEPKPERLWGAEPHQTFIWGSDAFIFFLQIHFCSFNSDNYQEVSWCETLHLHEICVFSLCKQTAGSMRPSWQQSHVCVTWSHASGFNKYLRRVQLSGCLLVCRGSVPGGAAHSVWTIPSSPWARRWRQTHRDETTTSSASGGDAPSILFCSWFADHRNVTFTDYWLSETVETFMKGCDCQSPVERSADRMFDPSRLHIRHNIQI